MNENRIIFVVAVGRLDAELMMIISRIKKNYINVVLLVMYVLYSYRNGIEWYVKWRWCKRDAMLVENFTTHMFIHIWRYARQVDLSFFFF